MQCVSCTGNSMLLASANMSAALRASLMESTYLPCAALAHGQEACVFKAMSSCGRKPHAASCALRGVASVVHEAAARSAAIMCAVVACDPEGDPVCVYCCDANSVITNANCGGCICCLPCSPLVCQWHHSVDDRGMQNWEPEYESAVNMAGASLLQA